ncbi:hypothetical protein SNEBB_006916 [Seison nebaliae]|nr:hypothetical protein SNEBB_006916 [Seison nebaliae]
MNKLYLCRHFTKRSLSSAANSSYSYETIKVTFPEKYVAKVELNRPKSLNSINLQMWKDIGNVFSSLKNDDNCRSIILTSSTSKAFTSGLDLQDTSLQTIVTSSKDSARKSMELYRLIEHHQKSFLNVYKCNKPVISAIGGYCIGAGVDLICATAIRYASEQTKFSIKEIDIGLAPDVGTLQFLPIICGNHSQLHELIFTAKNFDSKMAMDIGLISHLSSNYEEVVKDAIKLGVDISSKSPRAVQTARQCLIDLNLRKVEESLTRSCLHNMSMLQSPDIMIAIQKGMMKEKTTCDDFPK